MGVARPPAEPPASPPPGQDAESCPRCGSPHEPLQEYCLKCGLRLPLARSAVVTLSTAWRRRLPWYPGDWIWPLLLLLLVAALAGTIAYLATADDPGRETVVATTETSPASSTPTATTSTATATATTPTAPATTTTASTEPPPPRPPPPPPSSSALSSWPAGKSGYTTVLQSIPANQGKRAAIAYAKKATRLGMSQVGYLVSSEYSSLHPGYYVIFSGIYGSVGPARNNAATAAANGFPAAYPRQITP